MKMPEEVRQALKVLDKYEFKSTSCNAWGEFKMLSTFENDEFGFEFRLKPLKALTVEEAEKLDRVYTPHIILRHITEEEASYDIRATSENKREVALKDLAYATGEEAKRHAQEWLDDAKERVRK